MAIFEAKIATSILMQSLNFTIDPDVAKRVTYSPTLTMSIATRHSEEEGGDGKSSSQELMLGVSLRR